jgi:hypothetical protein
MWKIKKTLDPDNIMNPGKKLPTCDVDKAWPLQSL